jgi:hypothetical protein
VTWRRNRLGRRTVEAASHFSSCSRNGSFSSPPPPPSLFFLFSFSDVRHFFRLCLLALTFGHVPCQDATHARDVAKGEADRVRNGYDDDRRRREATLREKHQELALRKQTQVDSPTPPKTPLPLQLSDGQDNPTVSFTHFTAGRPRCLNTFRILFLFFLHRTC